MTVGDRDSRNERSALIWTPIGRDAPLVRDVLQRAGIDAIVCDTVGHACQSLSDEKTGMAIVAEEALSSAGIDQLRETLGKQPPWSDLPLVLLTGGGRSTEASLRRLRRMQVLGNVTLLERPLRSVTLVAAVQAALAARQRQLQIRDYIRDLQEAQQNLAQANADLKQFAFAASHDLQEPLRLVNIFSQLLVDRHVDPGNEQARQFANYIRAGVLRMEALLRDVLHYSRAIHTATDWPDEPFNLRVPLEEALLVMKLEIEETHAEVECGPLPTVRGDKNQLSLVFQNLISNSIKYTKPSVPPVICIQATERENEALIRVQDNGIGFDQMYAERIFDLFQRLNNREGVPGTGLGLAICRRTIEKHGGRIWAESTPGRGATFSFTLPVRHEENV